MKVKSTKSVHFPKFNWGINAGQTRDLPDVLDKKGKKDSKATKEAEEAILSHNAISKSDEKSSSDKK